MSPKTRNKPLTAEEKRMRRKEYDRKRREEMKHDPIRLEEMKQKERIKYESKLKKKQRKLIGDMTDREKRAQRERWREWSENSNQKKEEKNAKNQALPTPAIPPSISTSRQLRIASIARKKMTKGNFCSVAICKNSSIKAKKEGKWIRFFTIPKDGRRKQWILKCNRRDKLNPDNIKVCSEHFTIDDFTDTLKAQILNYPPRVLKKTAIPSVNLRPSTDKKKKRSTGKFRENKERAEFVEKILSESASSENYSSPQSIQATDESVFSENYSLPESIQATDESSYKPINLKLEDDCVNIMPLPDLQNLSVKSEHDCQSNDSISLTDLQNLSVKTEDDSKRNLCADLARQLEIVIEEKIQLERRLEQTESELILLKSKFSSFEKKFNEDTATKIIKGKRRTKSVKKVD